jgi:hypothetical protein
MTSAVVTEARDEAWPLSRAGEGVWCDRPLFIEKLKAGYNL